VAAAAVLPRLAADASRDPAATPTPLTAVIPLSAHRRRARPSAPAGAVPEVT